MNKYSKQIKRIILNKYDGKCAYCGHNLQIDDMSKSYYMNVEHIVPVSKGGKNRLSNYNPSCRYCNSLKGTKSLMEFLFLIVCKRNKIPKFNSREKKWLNSVFNINIDSYLLKICDFEFHFEKYFNSERNRL